MTWDTNCFASRLKNAPICFFLSCDLLIISNIFYFCRRIQQFTYLVEISVLCYFSYKILKMIERENEQSLTLMLHGASHYSQYWGWGSFIVRLRVLTVAWIPFLRWVGSPGTPKTVSFCWEACAPTLSTPPPPAHTHTGRSKTYPPPLPGKNRKGLCKTGYTTL